MQITQNKIKALIDEKGKARKCPKCDGIGLWLGYKCHICNGSGKATISIPKEWVVCNCGGKGCTECYGKGKRLKYEVGEEIDLEILCECKTWKKELGKKHGKIITLKIISETENEWRLCVA